METSKKFIKEIIDWSKVKTGTYFSAKINRKKCLGIIHIDECGDVFFCNNTEGSSYLSHKERFGFKYAVLLESDYLHEPEEFGIKNIILSEEKPEELEIPEIINWSKVKSGTYFEAKIDDVLMKGLIQKDQECIYLCNNEYGNDEDGDDMDVFGFKNMFYYDEEDSDYEVEYIKLFKSVPKDFKLPEKEKNKIIFPKYAGHKPKIMKGKVKFGCQEIPNKDIRFLIEHLID